MFKRSEEIITFSFNAFKNSTEISENLSPSSDISILAHLRTSYVIMILAKKSKEILSQFAEILFREN